MVVRIFCESEYKQAGERKTKMQYAYFHVRKPCIQKKLPDFEVKQLTIANESRNAVSTELKEKLTSLGIEVDMS